MSDPTAPGPAAELDWQENMQAARAAAHSYMKARGIAPDQVPDDEVTADLVTGLLHWLAEEDLDAGAVVNLAWLAWHREQQDIHAAPATCFHQFDPDVVEMDETSNGDELKLHVQCAHCQAEGTVLVEDHMVTWNAEDDDGDDEDEATPPGVVAEFPADVDLEALRAVERRAGVERDALETDGLVCRVIYGTEDAETFEAVWEALKGAPGVRRIYALEDVDGPGGTRRAPGA